MSIAVKRLLRRILWLLITQWRSLTLQQWPYESCQLCGKTFRITWSIGDIYWERVTGRYDGNGMMCIDCFIERASQLDIPIPDNAFVIHVFNPINDNGEKGDLIDVCLKV